MSTSALRKPLDLLALIKPRITLLVICTTLGGLYLAPGARSFDQVALLLLGTVLVVGGANTLNMYLERDSDALMRRTRNRPLPAGRLRPRTALWFGVALGVVAVPLLALAVNPLTGLLGLVALLGYVLVYTPMKRRSPWALVVGAVPGAIPPLMGWTAATGRLEVPGLLLFGVLFFWQIPHFLAIALYSTEDFARAGIRTTPNVNGVPAAKRQVVIWLAALLPTSLLLVPWGLAGTPYLVAAAIGGAVFFAWGVYGLVRESAGRSWARSLFLVSLVYLTTLFVVLAVEGRIHG
jgi:protoheme IX farnesyltransferase